MRVGGAYSKIRLGVGRGAEQGRKSGGKLGLGRGGGKGRLHRCQSLLFLYFLLRTQAFTHARTRTLALIQATCRRGNDPTVDRERHC